jgi:O-antigen ligase
LTSNLSFILHPSYFSLYINLSLALLWLFWFNQNYTFREHLIFVFVSMFFMLMQVFLQSKMGLICLVLLIIWMILYLMFYKKKYLLAIAAAVFIIMVTIISLKSIPFLAGRFDQSIDAITKEKNKVYQDESSALRLATWKSSIEVMNDNLWTGVGTGDVKDALLLRYKRDNYTFAFERKLNAHNQFLQTGVALGIIGLAVLLLQFLIPFVLGFNTNAMIYLVFLAILLLNFLVESMLETQAGVVFYALFNSFFFFRLHNQNNI